MSVEALEDRTLLSAVTIVTHGFNSNADAWVDSMADEIVTRIAAETPFQESDVAKYELTVDQSNVFLTQESVQSYLTADSGETVIRLDWGADSSSLSLSTLATAVRIADFVFAGESWIVDGALHLIGHSRGASLITALAAEFGERGVWVDQTTFLDAHPVDVDYPMDVSENVVFGDGYWREGGGAFSFDGEHVDGAFNAKLNQDHFAGGDIGYGGLSDVHSDVHLWYHGTIDNVDGFSDVVNGSGETVAAEDAGYWFSPDAYDAVAGNVPSGRDDIGYAFSRVVGNERPDSGVTQSLGGAGVRDLIDWSNADWPNVLDFTVDASDLEVDSGESIAVSYYYQDADSDSNVEFFLDLDKNPYNGNATILGPSFDLPSGTTALTLDSQDLPTAGVAAGNYYVAVKIADAGGRARWAYAHASVEIVDVGTLPNLFLNEVAVATDGPDNPNEYIEIRGDTGQDLTGMFVVFVESDSGSSLGEVQSGATGVIDLTGHAIGSNGFLVILDDASDPYSIAAGTTIVDVPGMDFENAAYTVFLVHVDPATGSVPVVGQDLDSGDDGLDALPTGWTILDGVSVLDGDAGDRGYADIVFSDNELGLTEPGATFIDTEFSLFSGGTDVINHVMRIGDSTGSAPADWVAFDHDAVSSAPNFTIGQSSDPAYAFGSVITDHLEASNPSAAVSTALIIDNGENGYTSSGFVAIPDATFPTPEGRDGDIENSQKGTGADVATWTFSGLTAGTYRVSATWSTHENRATNAPYTISDGVTLLVKTLVNQELEPNDFVDDGSAWEDLGIVTITGTDLIVELSDEADEYVIADAIRIDRFPTAPSPGALYLDDGDAGYADSGWNVSPVLEGRLNDIRYQAKGNGSQTAVWTFTDLTPGNYSVAATWSAHSNRASNAPYTIMNGSGGDVLEIVRSNQQMAPDDFFDNGSSWENLSIVTITGTELVVELANDANGFVIADAIRIEPTTVAPLPPGTIIDDGDTEFSTTAGWHLTPITEGRNGDVRFAAPGNGSRMATWTFTGLNPGVYRVSATWSPHANRTTNAPYEVFDGATSLGTVDVNQRIAPDDFSTLDSDWKDLMIVELTGDTLAVQLSNAADGFVIADAIRVQFLPMPEVVDASATAVDGQNSSTLTFNFSQPVAFATDSTAFLNEITITAQAANPAFNGGANGGPEFVEVTINAIDASLSSDGLTLTVNTDLRTPAGTDVRINQGALTHMIQHIAAAQTANAVVVPTATPLHEINTSITTSETTAAEFTLAYRNDVGFEITNTALFSGADVLPVRSDAVIEAAFHDFMTHKQNQGLLDNSDYTVAELNTLFSAPETKAIIPDANLRAALLSLAGTSAEGMIRLHLDGDNPSGLPRAIVFTDDISPRGLAEFIQNPDGTHETRILTSFQGDHFIHLSSVISHEGMHQDESDQAQAATVPSGFSTGNSLKSRFQNPVTY